MIKCAVTEILIVFFPHMQEFSEAERKLEMKRTLDKVKRLTCPICSNNFTTVPGFMYHQERCGVSPADLKNM